MNLIKINKAEVNQTKEVPGLLSSQIAYEVKAAKGELNYDGPKFSSEMWHQVMSFFRWTYKEMRSESQVRLYVNTKVGRWGAWAFPQEARTGMSAKEITVQETPEQALERFRSWKSEPSEDWVYFCTVHHHCSAGAFQSGTDEQNEKDQDGLHITVGNMDQDRHDIHARFYLGGNCFEPDLSLFWPIDPVLVGQVPEEMLDALARFQMCEKVTVDFPDAWRANVVEIKSERRPERLIRRDQESLPFDLEPDMPMWMQRERALMEINHRCEVEAITEPECLEMLQHLCRDPASDIIVHACLEHRVTPDELLEELKHYEFSY
jgi:hypothetical protein